MNERGMSPVIGVILMVAIVVILAAIVAAFVFEMAGQYQPMTHHTEIIHVTGREVLDNDLDIRIPSEGVYGDFRYIAYADNGDVYVAKDYTVFRNLTVGWHTVETLRAENKPVIVVEVMK